MPERPQRRRRARSARRIALLDQIRAMLRDSPRFLTTHEVADGLGHRVYYSDAFAALKQLADEGAIDKLKHPLLKNVLWGLPGKNRGLAYEYAVVEEERLRLQEALRAAPEPAGEGSWMQAYRTWWTETRQAF